MTRTVPRKPRRKNPPRSIPRDPKYLAWIRKQRCLCGRIHCDDYRVEAAHTGPHGIGIKGSDLKCIPLCAWHHRLGPTSYHNLSEKRFCEHWGIDLEAEVARLQRRFGK